MAFNKAKTQETAVRYLNQGKVAEAIREYQQILRYDPKDQATLMTVGDLFARMGDMLQALEYFERLAQVYLSDGFNSKAIAIYKKIAKLAPNELPPLERLADLYVQQGVLSEARPLFLQIAEVHLKANRSQRAVEVLRRLLEVEPENLRVQMKLAELYSAIGQKKEAAQTYLNYSRRLLDRGEGAEAQKYLERALEVEPENPAGHLLKAQGLISAGQPEKAIPMLESLPDAQEGGETTILFTDCLLKAGQASRAEKLARKVFARGHEHYALLFRVASALIEAGHPVDAFPILNDLRDAMIEAGEQDKLMNAFTNLVERTPDRLEPLEAYVELCRHTSDSFRLPDAMGRLAAAAAAKGEWEKAEGLLSEMLERDPGNEKILDRLNQVRAHQGLPAEAPVEGVVTLTTGETPAPVIAEPKLSDETERYIAQALTDVDLFSSYGLIQKATHLLENVLLRAPRHAPTLERLLDIHLGAGDRKHTAEMAAKLEKIYLERGDHVAAERFTELRNRFEKLVGPKPAAAPVAAAPPAPAEFAVPAAEPEVPAEMPPVAPEVPAPPVIQAQAPAPVAEQEIDLSEEWEALSKEMEEAAAPAAAAPPAQKPAEFPVPEPAPVEEPAAVAPLAKESVAEAPVTEPAAEEIELSVPAPVEETAPEAAPEVVPAAAFEDESVAAFDLELIPAEPAPETVKKEVMTTDEFLSELAAEVEALDAVVAEPPAPVKTAAPPPPKKTAPVPAPVVPATLPSKAPQPVAARAAGSDGGSLSELEEVFQEFRSELGELGEEDEDLETHYNLGIAYREMGLLDEAIGEFQKVAKGVQSGRPFRYAMQCSTLLGLTFMDKGEPKIASLWYQRALGIPGLDQETVLALRYDLGIAQELAGDSPAALESFRQVYAMNIDYRDVADRIATLQKR